MSKYVHKKHGIIIGSDNIFFVTGDGELRDGYRAILRAQSYKFDQYNGINVYIQTPVEQILWNRSREDVYDDELDRIENKTIWRLSPWVKGWLDNEVGEYQKDWDTYSVVKNRSDRVLFFKKRSDALKLYKKLDSVIAGIKLPKG